ncbi:Sec-independent protein translocase subunit TatA [Melissospora conviva]|uniref:Sec-independent protein translocase subunit TatA n=1 Tax=Melissospora conviva TaxID=3388432 RepID=UPI003B767E3F
MSGVFKPWHIIVLVVVLVLLFGAKRLPDAARSLGRSLRILKAETKSLADDDRDLAEKADAQAGYQTLPPQAPGQPQPTYQPPQAPGQPQPTYQPPVAEPVQRPRDN